MSEMQADERQKVLDTFWEKAEQARAKGDANDARGWLEGMIELDEKNIAAWLRLAELSPDARERMSRYVQVLEFDPKNAEARDGIRKTRRLL